MWRNKATKKRKEEVVENGEAKEEDELSNNPDASSPSKAPLKTEVMSTEELDVLFAKEPFVKLPQCSHKMSCVLVPC